MKAIVATLDWVLNLRPFTNYRHTICRALGILVAVYAYVSTADWAVAIYNLPDIPTEWLAGITAYLATQGIAFGKAHMLPKPPTP